MIHLIIFINYLTLNCKIGLKFDAFLPNRSTAPSPLANKFALKFLSLQLSQLFFIKVFQLSIHPMVQ